MKHQPAPLVGRDDERDALMRVVESVRSGLSGVLALRGEPGIGKTALLDWLELRCDGLTVVRVRGVESEMTLGYAALHQVVHPFRAGIDHLPAPQARALRAVFGTVDDVVPDRFLVGLATLSLLSDAADNAGGVVVIVDDGHWLDEESAHALGFVARRLHADRVGMVIALREPWDAPAFAELPRSVVGPLPAELSTELLSVRHDGDLAASVRGRLVDDAKGNPLALLELSRMLTAEQRAGTEPLPTPWAIDRDLQSQFLRRVRLLPVDTQILMLVAATDTTGDAHLVRRAAEELGCPVEASEPAEWAGLLRVDPVVEFRHPLVRSAVYQGASPHDRRRAHGALAAVTDAERDPDRRAWHRAAAALGPDADVADELERAAERARASGGYATSAAFSRRAADLTPDPDRRASRYLAASAAFLNARNHRGAQSALDLAGPDLVDPRLAAHARRLAATICFVAPAATEEERRDLRRPHRHEAAAMMIDAATALAPIDVRTARATLLEAFPMAIYFGRWSTASAADVGRVIRQFPLPDGTVATSLDLLMDGLADLFIDGYADAVPTLRRAVAAMQDDPDLRRAPQHMVLGGYAGFALGEDEWLQQLDLEAAEISRNLGAYQVIPSILFYLCLSHVRLGALEAAAEYFDERNNLQGLFPYDGLGDALKLVLSAWWGEEQDVRTAARSVGERATEHGVALIADTVDYAMCVLELGLGNYEAAATLEADRLQESLALASLRAADAVEAHVRSHDVEGARAPFEWLANRAEATQSLLDLGLAERGGALLADAAHAEAHFERSVQHLERAGGGLHLARTRLLYGEWLRRQQRRRDARTELSAALDAFSAARAAAFERRARIELLATGATVRKRRPETRDDLTPQEEQVARLAAGGATNPEIGARLFISSSTVDYHLRKVYRKLGITSRRELVHTDYVGGGLDQRRRR